MSSWLESRRALAMLAIGWLGFVVFAWPGLFTQDSLDQLTEARAGVFTDAHPPLMALIWRYVDMLIAGTLGMLVLQTGTLVAGLYLLLCRATRPGVAAACAIGLLWFPPIAAPMTVIWKDSLMAGTCVLGFALVLDERKRVKVAGLVLLVLGTAFRHNGPALALPLIVLGFEWNPGRRALYRYALSLAMWLALVIANLGIHHALTDRKMHFWVSTLAVMDIAGTLCFDSRHYSDAELERMFAGTGLRVHENIEATMCRLFSTATPMRLSQAGLWDLPAAGDTPAPLEIRTAMTRVWKDVVPARPLPYLGYRIAVFKRAIGWSSTMWGLVTPRVSNVAINRPWLLPQLGVSTDHWSFQAAWIEGMTWLADSTPLFRPWLYLLVALGGLVVARRQRLIATLLLGGIVMEGSLFIAAMSPDFRYSHWLVLSTCTALVMWVLERARARTSANQSAAN